MDYWRLFLVTAALMGAMAFLTCLCCWVSTTVRDIRLRREWARQEREEQEIEERRAHAPRYMTYEQFREDVLGCAVPIDEILDRLNGQLPPKAANIQKAGLSIPISMPALIFGSLLLLGRSHYGLKMNTPTLQFIETIVKDGLDQWNKTLTRKPEGSA
jgi:hypothetical protein